jgi:hypothetical protein
MEVRAKSFFRFRFNGLGDPHAELVRTYVTNIAAHLYGNRKGKIHPKQVTKAQRGSRGTAVLFL